MLSRLPTYFVFFVSFLLGGRPPNPEPSEDEKMKSFDLWDCLIVKIRPLYTASTLCFGFLIYEGTES